MTEEKIGRIIWTMLPNGVESDQNGNRYPKLSVLVSPRLGKNDELYKLKDFEDLGFLDWPKKVKQLLNYKGGFQLNVAPAGSDDQKTFMLIPTSEPPRSDLWKALFYKATDVIGYSFDRYDDKNIISYPVANILNFIKEKYAEIASTFSNELPTLSSLDDYFSNIAIFESKECEYRPEIANFLQLSKFFIKLSKDSSDYIKPSIPDMDFHTMVSSLGEYPKVLRWLGLVIDFSVVKVLQDGTLGYVNAGDIPKNSIIWIYNDYFSEGIDKALKTNCVLDYFKGTFSAASRTDHQNSSAGEKGMLKLSDSKYEVIQVDVDGAAIKVFDLANALKRTINHYNWYGTKWNATLKDFTEPSSTPDEKIASLPALRSGGISVVRTGRANELHDEFVKARLLNDSIFPDPLDSNMDNPDGSSLFAEDLVRGYRIDVWNSQSGRWNSLCKRVGCYTFLSKNGEIDISEIEDEGWTSLGITQNPPSSSDNAPNDIYLHESLFHWDGWSLSAPRPGKIIISPKSGVEPGLINEVGTEDYIGVGATENPGEHILPLKTEFAPVRGSLPRLRFDVKYRLRARAVDLAGNGVRMEDLDPEDFTLASPEITYKRFEPVASPILISPKDDEQSSPGSSLERLVISTDCPMDSRWVAPPKVSQLLAETHMMFDRSFGDDPKGKRKAVRERDYEICNRDGMFDPDVSDTTPYLPDPIAMGATVQGFNGKSISHTFYRHHKWPDAEPFLMILEKGDTNKWSYKEEYTSENKKINILRVELAEASTERFLISSALGFGSASRLEMMGIRQWTIDKELPFDDKLALKGKHWMLTPYREIVLVHAVKKPLIEPIPLLLTNSTNLKTSIGQTHADLLGKIYLDGKSTGKVDLVAEWYESIDNPQDNYPKVNALNKAIRMKSHVFEAPINLDGNVLELNGGNVYYSANEKLSSEWANLGGLCPSYPIELKRADVLSLGKFAKKRVAKKSVAYTILSPPRHDFGDTKYRRVEYTPVATTRFREYFNPERNKISADSDSEIEFSRSGPKIVLDIPNSARPPKPKVLYVIPAYGWREEEEFDRVKRYRSGGYLRVYLDRPWFASGDGELLGVVTAQYSPIPRPHSEGFAFKDWGKYDAIDLKGQRFFSGYNEETTFSEKYCIINEGHFRHILINRANRGYLRMNESLILEDGYKLSIKAFFVNKNIFNLELSKDGYFVESKSIEITDGSDNTYYHKIKVNEIHDLVTIAVHFKRSAENLLYDGIWQISDESIFRARTYPNCSNKFLQHITQIGTDPIQKTCKIIDTTQIDLEDCKAESGLMLDELKNPNGSYSEQNKVSVAGYKVGWNEDRGLWYADIKIKPGNSYYPFIRLALVRYQPNSIFDGSDDARISRVTLADFVQIAPDRTATLIWEDIDQNILRVSVSGVAPRQNAPNFYGNLVYVTIEKKVAGIEDENLCWSPVGESIQLESDEITKEIDEQVTWSGVIDIKKHIRSDPIKPGKYRLVIQEKEMYKKDYVGESAIYYQRLVYATTFKL